jgi:hypothetical protein
MKLTWIILIILIVIVLGVLGLWYFRIWPFKCPNYIDVMPPRLEPVWGKFCPNTLRAY